MNGNIKTIINNEFDYSNILPTIDHIVYLVEYCSNVYNEFIRICDEDEEKNKQYKMEYKEYNYKKNYGSGFEVYIQEHTYNSIQCKSKEEFASAIADGNLKSVLKLEIKLDINFKRGKGENLEEHDHSFKIIFKPYEIKLARQSNYNDNDMNQIENNIRDFLSKFPIANSIFCDRRGE